VLLLLVACASCAHVGAGGATLALADDVEVRRLTPSVWLHVTYGDHHHNIATNGLLVETRQGTVLIDSGWNDAQAARLFDFAATRLHRPISDVIVTHAHRDRIGGVGEALRRGARVHALVRTIEHAHQRGQAVPDVATPERAALTVGGVALELLFPGAGHTDDNLVVWLPRDRVLYGGCLLKSAAATDLGNIADADLAAWPASLHRVVEAFPHAAVVVPGHDTLGGDPLRRTAELLAASPR
jgi:metallo-beta-lactamase class B